MTPHRQNAGTLEIVERSPEMREELTTDPVHHVKHQREYLGWGVFALIK